MKKLGVPCAWLLLFLFIGCSTVRVSQDYDLSQSYLGLRTYQWRVTDKKDAGDPRINNSLTDARIRGTLESVMAEKGFRKNSGAASDLYVDYHYTLKTRLEQNEPRTGFGFGFGHYGRHAGIGIHTGTSVDQYEQGLLVIDLVDGKNGSILWRGNGTHRFNTHASPEKRVEIINELVRRIMEQFPPM